MELYITALYFTVTTITTVGYGDISGTNTTERLVSIFLMILGVVFFSFSTGALTSII
jgi:voltage-gated potassium channel Kch